MGLTSLTDNTETLKGLDETNRTISVVRVGQGFSHKFNITTILQRSGKMFLVDLANRQN